MKKLVLCYVSIPFLFVSCEKTTEPYFTSFQLEMRNYYNGDSMPNTPFAITGIYDSGYNFEDTTNSYGNYSKGFEHLNKTNFDCSVAAYSDYFLANRSGQIVAGENTEIEVDVIPLANFGYNFDCSASGSGEIQFVQRQIIYPFVPNEFVLNSGYGQSNFINYPYCGSNGYYQKVFSGDWLVTYQKRNSSSSAWVQYSDTVYVAPGENFLYTILY